MEDFTSFICYAMKGTMRKLERQIGREFEKFGINLAQSFVLFSLLENDGLTLTEVGARSKIENSTLTTMVDRLEKDGLVERRLDPQDRRMVRLFITDQGRELAEAVLSKGAEFNQYLKKHLNGLEVDLLKSLAIIQEVVD
ncbi:MAG: MarR family winged helix-turn-helix transcriptional regulator [Candidatus Saccharibacteria bacterium]